MTHTCECVFTERTVASSSYVARRVLSEIIYVDYDKAYKMQSDVLGIVIALEG